MRVYVRRSHGGRAYGWDCGEGCGLIQVDSKTMVEALETAVKPRLARIATDAATAANDDGNFMSEVAEAAEVRATVHCTRE